MAGKQITIPEGPFPVDNSRLSAVGCSTRFLMEHGFGYQSRTGKEAAHVGSVGHSGLKTWYKGGTVEQAIDIMRAEYAALLPGGVPEERLTFKNLEIVFRQWARRNPREKLPYDWDVGVVDVPISVPLDDNGEFMFYAKIDLPTMEKSTGFWWPLDHKFRSKINDWWLRKFRMSSQMTGYVWALGKRVGAACPGAFPNVLELALVPSSSRKCTEHKVKYSECGHLHVRCELFVLNRNPEVIAGWHRDAVERARKCRTLCMLYPSLEYVQAAPQEGQFYDMCTFCDYVKWCGMGRPMNAIDGLFEYKPWEPWGEE